MPSRALWRLGGGLPSVLHNCNPYVGSALYNPYTIPTLRLYNPYIAAILITVVVAVFFYKHKSNSIDNIALLNEFPKMGLDPSTIPICDNP